MRGLVAVALIVLLAGSAGAQTWVAEMQQVRQDYNDTDGLGAGTIVGTSCRQQNPAASPGTVPFPQRDVASRNAATEGMVP